MGRTTTILGIDVSPRSDSNSGHLLAEVLRGVGPDSGATVVEQVRLADERIDCLGCEQCFGAVGVHGDGIDRVLALMVRSDAVVVATPTCYGMPPALGVVLLDRADPLWRDGLRLQGKLGAVIVNGASDPAEHPSVRRCADNLIAFFEQQEMPHAEAVLLGNTAQYPEQRFPDPLPAAARDAVSPLVDEIRGWAARGR